MGKKLLSLILCLSLTLSLALSLAPMEALAQTANGELRTDFKIKDTIVAQTSYQVKDLDGNEHNWHSVFGSGTDAAILIFFDGTDSWGEREDSKAAIQSIATSNQVYDWVSSEKLNLIAVESFAFPDVSANQSDVTDFMDEISGENKGFFNIYYGGSCGHLWLEYAELAYSSISPAAGGVALSCPLVLVVDGAGDIRYTSMGQFDIDTCTDALAALIDTPSVDPVTVTVAATQHYDWAQDVFDQVKAQRSDMVLDKTLTEYAMQRAVEIALFYDHTRPDGTDWSSIFDENYTDFTQIAENIQWCRGNGSVEVDTVIQDTLSAAAANLSDSRFTQIGVGCFEGPDGIYCVLLFGNRISDPIGETVNRRDTVSTGVPVETLAERLDKHARSTLEVISRTDPQRTLFLSNCNQGIPGFSPYVNLVPLVDSDIMDETEPEIRIATTSVNTDDPSKGIGWVTVTASAPGTGTIYFRAYEGDETPEKTMLIVNGTTSPLTSDMFDSKELQIPYGSRIEDHIECKDPNLILGQDYEITYDDDINAGTMITVTITGKGWYTGLVTFPSFEIVRAERALTVSVGDDNTLYLDTPVTSITVKDNAEDDSPSYTYASSDEDIVKVDADGQITPVHEGCAYITVKAPATMNYKAANPITVTVTVKKLTERTIAFNSPSAEITYGDSLINSAKPSVGGGTVTYSSDDEAVVKVDPETGEITTVSVGRTTIQATVNQSDGYAEASAVYELTVNPKELTIELESVDDKTYDGNPFTNATVEFKGLAGNDTLTEGQDYTVISEFESADAGDGKSVTVTVELKNPNYTLANDTITTTAAIFRKDLGKLSTAVSLWNTAGAVASIDLADCFPDDVPDDDFKFEVAPGGTYLGLEEPVEAGGILTLTARANGDYSAGDTVTVKVTGINHEGIITITVSYGGKTPVIITGVEAAVGLVYNGDRHNGYIGTPTSGEYSGPYEFIYEKLEGTDYVQMYAPPVNAGDYRVTIRVPETEQNYTGRSEPLKFTIAKAMITITADDKSALAGNAVPTYTCRIEGLVRGDRLMTPPTLVCDADMSKVGTYVISVSGAQAMNDNYDITYINGRLTIIASNPGSGIPNGSIIGGPATITAHEITVPQSVTGGAISVSAPNANKGTTVIITVAPDEGYRLDTLTITDASGNVIDLTKRNNTQYTFTMPDSQVSIDVAFTPEDDSRTDISFTDVVAGAYYYDAVHWAVEQGITLGSSDTTFSPNLAVDRAQMVTFLWRAAGSPEVSDTSTVFTDLDPDAYYYQAVLWAVAQGITDGTSSTTFSPNWTVDRAQTVAFLYRFAGAPAVEADSTFTDVEDNQYYTFAVQWAVEQGITNGTGEHQFSPGLECTRGQVVTFLYRNSVSSHPSF